MEERLNAFYTKGEAESRCLAVRIMKLKRNQQGLAFIPHKYRREDVERQGVGKKGESNPLA